MRPHEIPADLTRGPFTVATARAAGVSPKILRGRRFQSPHHGVHVLAATNGGEREAVAAALLVLPAGSLATGVTGLRLHGVEVGPPSPMRFVTTHARQVRRPGIKVTRVTRLPERWDDLAAIPEHCWLVAALELDLVELVTAADWLLRLRVTSRRALTAYVASSSSRGAAAARAAVEKIRDRVDSPRETRLRLCLVLAGLPTPECNPTIRGDGAYGRVDLVYLEFRILIEYEGDQHRTDRFQWNRDIDRQEGFTRDQWTLLRITAERARRPRWIVTRVYEMLREAGYAGPPPTFDEQWRRLFE